MQPGDSASTEPGIEIRFVDTVTEVDGILQTIESDMVGVDVERSDAQRYYRRAALVQVGRAGICALFDAVAIDRLDPLNAFLGASKTTVLHAADNDLVPLARLGVHPDRIADTAVAAAVLGMATGLEALLADLLGVEPVGDKSAFQRADWEQRPLPDDMASYAASDVVHLPELWRLLAHRLDDTGRTDWYRQELAARIEHPEADRDWRQLKGIGRLSAQQRAIARSVWLQREELARTFDLAPNHLLREEAIVKIAQQPPTTVAGLVRIAQRRNAALRTHAPPLFDAVVRGLDAEPEPARSDDRRAMNDRDRRTIDGLRRARARVAEQLAIDPGVLCPARPLAAAVMSDPTDAESLCAAAALRPWQIELLAEPLWDAYCAAATSEESTEA